MVACVAETPRDAPSRERGAISIQVALFLPILVIILIGGIEVWKVLYLQEVLNDAAYQGVRLFAMQPDHISPDGSPIPLQVEALVKRYVASNPFITTFYPPQELENALWVRLDPPYPVNSPQFWTPQCGQTVAVEVRLTWYVGKGWTQGPDNWSQDQDPDSQGPWMPFLNTYGVLTGRASGVVLCERSKDIE